MFESLTEHTKDVETVSFNEMDKEMEEEEVLNCLLQLPTATRTVFSLFAIDGFSHKEICEKFNIEVELNTKDPDQARRYQEKKANDEVLFAINAEASQLFQLKYQE